MKQNLLVEAKMANVDTNIGDSVRNFFKAMRCLAIIGGLIGTLWGPAQGWALDPKADECLPFQVMAPHIKFFGYFASAMDGVGSGDYINDISDHSNIAWIAGNISNKVSKAARNGMKSIISMRWELFDEYLNLRSDYQAAWQNIASTVRTAGIEHVAAFYPLDEPYWTASQNCVISPSTCVTPEQMTTNLATVNALIHATFPGVPVAVIFAASTLRNNKFVIPNGYDWVGFDCYHGTFEDCGGRSMSWYVERLRSKLIANQRLIAVPQAIMPAQATEGETRGMLAENDKYMQLICSSPEFIGIFPFLWDGSEGNLGAKSLPAVKARYQAIGKSVLKR